MKEMLIKVEGMKCAGCSLGLEGALEDLPFVASAEADHVAGTAKLRSNPQISSQGQNAF